MWNGQKIVYILIKYYGICYDLIFDIIYKYLVQFINYNYYDVCYDLIFGTILYLCILYTS